MTTARLDDPVRARRTQWWREARFGMFIHWGLYAIPGMGEWVQYFHRIPIKQYVELARVFQPRPGCMRAWARLARQAGMRYMVLTTKHHDGFCLFDSKHTDFTAARTAARRDLVAEYVAAARAEGLRVGLYYSIKDWHHPNYPFAETDPVVLLEPQARRPNVAAYYAYLQGQLRELLTNYGPIDILWFDGRDPIFDGPALARLIRGWQPEVLINNRLLSKDEDFITPEQAIPDVPVVENGHPVIWEACMTLTGNAWGYNRYDRDFRPARDLIRLLVQAAHCGGNFLLNVGPKPDGVIPREAARRLREIGRWLKDHDATVRGAGSLPAGSLGTGKPAGRGIKRVTGKINYEVIRGHPIRVSGRILDNEWRGAAVVRVAQDTHFDYSSERYPGSFRYGFCAYSWRAMHAAGVLYLGVEVQSPTRKPRAFLEHEGGDEVRFLFAANLMRDRNEYNPEAFEITVDAAGQTWMPNEGRDKGCIFRHAVCATAIGYNVVLAVPLAMMLKDRLKPDSRLAPGDLFRFNIMVVQPAPSYAYRRTRRGNGSRRWWETLTPPGRGPAHGLYWKGDSVGQEPFTNCSIWGLCRLAK